MKKITLDVARISRSATLLLCGVLILLPFAADASTTNGTIDGTNRWAWSASAGWIDFGTTAGNIHVTDSALSGYAYGENTGWISLNCSNTNSCADDDYAVANDGTGTLSGYAWGAATGWINFAPTGGGVTINSSGVFSGDAYAEDIGWIVFTTDHPVTTDWRHISSSPSPATGGNGAPLNGPMSIGYVSAVGVTPPSSPPPSIVAPATSPTTTTPVTLPPPTYTFSKNHHLGDNGADITLLQEFLNTHGIPITATGAGSLGHETTYFGSLTKRAVIAFQKSHGITPAAGYLGPLTRAYITNNY
ncbi:MAG TPA: peptidoglycan-binding domain-containing protein [Candidatus Paceibacterota bacterium]|nr:peptidoglycan-binding domain-containing protein [Candidatus Paceibacterota bacterium]